MSLLLRPAYWGAHVLMVLLATAAVLLGFWQLNVWQGHRDAAKNEILNVAPKPLVDVMGGDSPFPGEFIGQPVTFSGTWRDELFFISDRARGQRTGFWVVQPLAVDGSKSAMLVVRGWSADRDANPVQGKAKLLGWLQYGEGSGAVDPDHSDNVFPEMRIANFIEQVPQDLYGGYVLTKTADPAAATAGLGAVHPTDVPKLNRTTGLRNLLYSIEWWIFGGFAVAVWVRWCRDQVAASREAEA